MSKLQDKKAITQLFAGLMAQPELLDNKEFDLQPDDFVERLHKIIFAAIKNLHLNEAVKISPIEIDLYLSNYTDLYRIFNENSGTDYLQKIEELGEPDNFSMHYQRIKKFSFLRECKKVGIDVADIYDDKIVDLQEEQKRNAQFDRMTLNDMAKHFELKMIEIREQFVNSSSVNGGHISENTREIIESKKGTPNYGAPMASHYLNYILRASRRKKLFLKHGNTGSGKSRLGMANLAVKTIPVIWDCKTKKWVKTGANGSGLFISTELDEEESKLPFLCYIADIEEDLIHDNKLTQEQQERLDIAVNILEKSHLWFEELSDFDIDDVEALVVKYINKHDIDSIEFDYIHMSLKLLTSLSEKGVKNLREDQVLLLMGIALKNICNKYDIHIESSTQLNDNQSQNDNMDQSWIRGSKALADKIDAGYIILEIREKDKKIIDAIYASGNANLPFGIEPNITLNVYKNRGGRFKRVRVYGHFNRGSLRFTDLFCTTYEGELLPSMEKRNIIMSDLDEGMTLEEYLAYDTDELDNIQVEEVEEDSLPDAFFEEVPPSEKFAF